MIRPVIRPSTTPSLFTISSNNTTSFWLVLDLSNGGTFTLPKPRHVALYEELNPRDRWVRGKIDEKICVRSALLNKNGSRPL